ncbi:N-6 DNA methylase [Candidatus Phytoplasma solani]|uniref:site-specific DNA-methyltransferase (adenine-specific) n=1 Tax=Candidatus Phytoplasma solani TaxID=69896 RepID=A0A421NX89_9MOLU|nr:N-6 DNA methylase [Candidatus Phytoplasma solani]RMI88622.1 type I restriction enzyme subunit M [Candidatus Phytoplasma solani]
MSQNSISKLDINNCNQKIDQLANNIRASIGLEHIRFRDYILPLICFRYLSQNFEKIICEEKYFANIEEYKKAWNETLEIKNNDNFKQQIIKITQYVISPDYLWSKLVKKIENNSFDYESIDKALKMISDSQNQLFKNLFPGFNKDEEIFPNYDKKNHFFKKLIEGINDITLNEANCGQCLGEMYTYLMERFAREAGKAGGEFFTPTCVSQLLAKITVDKKTKDNTNTNIETIYDPCCGSGTLLLSVLDVKRKKEDKTFQEVSFKTKIFGQEINPNNFNLARKNFILNNYIYNVDITCGNTLLQPSNSHLNKKFDLIVANPPYGVTWYDQTDKKYLDYRLCFCGGVLPRVNRSELPFLNHMMSLLDQGGVLGVVLPSSFFCEKYSFSIRKFLIDENKIDTIIKLPNKMFYTISEKTIIYILIIKNCKSDNEVCFLDASNMGQQLVSGNKQIIFKDSDIEKIINLIDRTQDIKDNNKKIVSNDEIKKNNYLLTTNQYIKPNYQKQEIDYDKNLKKIKNLYHQIDALNQQLHVKQNELITLNKTKTSKSVTCHIKDILEEVSVFNKDDYPYDICSVDTNKGLILRDQKKQFKGDKSKYKIVFSENIAINTSEWFQHKSVVCNKLKKPVLVSPSYKVYCCKNNFNYEYMCYFLKSQSFFQKSGHIQKENNRGSIFFELFDELTFSFPDVATQNQIVKYYDLINDLINELTQKTNELKELERKYIFII